MEIFLENMFGKIVFVICFKKVLTKLFTTRKRRLNHMSLSHFFKIEIKRTNKGGILGAPLQIFCIF